MNKKTKKRILQAILYVILGCVTIMSASVFIVFMYFSGTFLPGMHIARYTLYAVLFAIILIAGWFVCEGYGYFCHVAKKRR